MSAVSAELAEPTAPAVAPRRFGWAAASLIVACLLLVLFPGDTQLRNDEQDLLFAAAQANLDGRLASVGLMGSTGVRYGPLPTQFYQLALLLTSDIRNVVLIRAFLFAVSMSAALWSIGRSLRLRPAFIGFFLAAPWVWYYVRTPWDNTFCLPLGCGLLAAYIRWMQRPTPLRAAACGALAAMMPLVHLAAVALPAAVTMHAALRRPRAVLRSLPVAALAAAIACSTSLPYLRSLPGRTVDSFTPWPDFDPAESLEIAAYALRAPELLGAAESYYQPHRPGWVRGVLHVTAAIGWATYVWFGAGILIALLQHPNGDLTRAVAAVSLVALVLLGGVLSMADVTVQPHYFVGVYAPTVVLCWIGADAIWKNRLGRWLLVIAPIVAVIGTTLVIFALIHRNGGAADRHFGHSIGTLMGVVDGLRGQRVPDLYTDSGELHLRGHTIAQLRWIDARGRPPAGDGLAFTVELRRAFPEDHHLRVRPGPIDDADRVFRIDAWPDPVDPD